MATARRRARADGFDGVAVRGAGEAAAWARRTTSVRGRAVGVVALVLVLPGSKLLPHLEESGRAGARLAAIVATTPALRERAAAKEANFVALVARLLVERGAAADEADLVALTECGVLAHAIRTWRADPGSPRRHVDRAFALLGGLVGA